MTDQDNLRDRIAYILESHAHMAMDQQACAIIDELGLTVETALSFDEIPEHLQGQFIDGAVLAEWAEGKPKKSRIISAWEWEKQ